MDIISSYYKHLFYPMPSNRRPDLFKHWCSKSPFKYKESSLLWLARQNQHGIRINPVNDSAKRILLQEIIKNA